MLIHVIIPRTNDNVMAHCMTSKRFSKAIRRPKLEIVRRIEQVVKTKKFADKQQTAIRDDE